MGWTGGSLRGRLVLAFVAVAVLAAVLIGVITLSLIRLLPERGLEQQLADQAQAVSDTVAGPAPGPAAVRPGPGPAAGGDRGLPPGRRRHPAPPARLPGPQPPRPARPGPRRRPVRRPGPGAGGHRHRRRAGLGRGPGRPARPSLRRRVIPGARPSCARAAGCCWSTRSAASGSACSRWWPGGCCWPRPWRWRWRPWPPGCWPAGSPPPSAGWSRPPAGSATATCRQGSRSTATARSPRSPPPSTTWPPAWNGPRPSSAPSWPASATSSRPR